MSQPSIEDMELLKAHLEKKGLNGGSDSTVRIPDDQPLEALLKAAPSPPITAEEEKKPPAKWEPLQLNARHREIMRRILEGGSYIEIAEAMGIHKQTVMIVCTSKLFIAELQKMEAELDYSVIKRAEGMSNEALDQVKLLMRKGRSQNIQFQAASRILDTAGYSKIDKKVIGIVDGAEVIREMNKARREAFRRNQESGGSNGSSSSENKPGSSTDDYETAELSEVKQG